MHKKKINNNQLLGIHTRSIKDNSLKYFEIANQISWKKKDHNDVTNCYTGKIMCINMCKNMCTLRGVKICAYQISACVQLCTH